MRLLFDQNLSYQLVARLLPEYRGSVHVRDVGLNAADDQAIWGYAAQQGLTIVSRTRTSSSGPLVYGYPPKVVWIRLGTAPQQQLRHCYVPDGRPARIRGGCHGILLGALVMYDLGHSG